VGDDTLGAACQLRQARLWGVMPGSLASSMVCVAAKWRGRARSNSAIIRVVRKRLLLQVLQGTSDANIRFDDLRSLLTTLGFVERVKGSHHIFARPDVMEILNLQPRGSLAKPYQVKQVRTVIVRYKLAEGVE
jgi:hypothetical protein